MSSLIFLRIQSFLTESPRWLLTKGREAAAYRIVFNQKFDMEFSEKATKAKEAEKEVRFFRHSNCTQCIFEIFMHFVW